MTWADFWALIDTLNGEATQEGCQRLAEKLGRRSVHDVIGFAERHAEALYRLDQEKFGTLPVADLSDRDGPPPRPGPPRPRKTVGAPQLTEKSRTRQRSGPRLSREPL
ncbi:DUF4240 domain-containing protein [Streptomyces sp. IMTB 1903]|uniref:DUF4240 domain-containing protein n=1 Tax=Streptomyces sp. IMTB 1903 TaxID=1776680 RepID=UPI000D17A0C3|nr:DUF4240 domain-containing protein [Streptomyces sp. IMTB 1903]